MLHFAMLSDEIVAALTLIQAPAAKGQGVDEMALWSGSVVLQDEDAAAIALIQARKSKWQGVDEMTVWSARVVLHDEGWGPLHSLGG